MTHDSYRRQSSSSKMITKKIIQIVNYCVTQLLRRQMTNFWCSSAVILFYTKKCLPKCCKIFKAKPLLSYKCEHSWWKKVKNLVKKERKSESNTNGQNKMTKNLAGRYEKNLACRFRQKGKKIRLTKLERVPGSWRGNESEKEKKQILIFILTRPRPMELR